MIALRSLLLGTVITALSAAAGPDFSLPLLVWNERTRVADTLRAPSRGLLVLVLWDLDCPWCRAEVNTLDRLRAHCPESLSLASLRLPLHPGDRRKALSVLPRSFRALVARPPTQFPETTPVALAFDSTGRIRRAWIGWLPADSLAFLCPIPNSDTPKKF